MADVGDVAIQDTDDVRNFARITEVARRVTKGGCLLVAVGGDHSISFPLGRGVLAPDGIDVVHIDAHADFLTSSTVRASRCKPAAPARRAAVRV